MTKPGFLGRFDVGQNRDKTYQCGLKQFKNIGALHDTLTSSFLLAFLEIRAIATDRIEHPLKLKNIARETSETLQMRKNPIVSPRRTFGEAAGSKMRGSCLTMNAASEVRSRLSGNSAQSSGVSGGGLDFNEIGKGFAGRC